MRGHSPASGRCPSYVRTWTGFVYLATVLDCCTKKVVGYAMADHMYAAHAPGDPVAAQSWWLPGFGTDPISDPNSDFTQLDTSMQQQAGLSPSGGHSMYTNSGTTSAHNLGQILRGDTPDYIVPKKF